MAFCSTCGAEVAGRFCAKCGTAIGPAAGAGPQAPPPTGNPQYGAPQYQQQQPPPQYQQQYQQPYTQNPQYAPQPQAGGLSDNIAAALCYLGWVVTGVIFLVVAPFNQSKFVRFHAFQSIFTCVGLVIVDIALSIISRIVIHILPILGLVFVPIWLLFGLIWFALWLFLMYKAYSNEKFSLPIVGPLAEKQA